MNSVSETILPVVSSIKDAEGKWALYCVTRPSPDALLLLNRANQFKTFEQFVSFWSRCVWHFELKNTICDARAVPRAKECKTPSFDGSTYIQLQFYLYKNTKRRKGSLRKVAPAEA